MIELYTDGSTLKNPGPGGWACIIIKEEEEKIMQGSETQTTNNRMELQAVISGLDSFKTKEKFNIFCDSAYIVNCFSQKWFVKWRRNGWISSAGKQVENKDLWEKLLSLNEKHDVTWTKVKGHADNITHNRCDVLARDAARNKL